MSEPTAPQETPDRRRCQAHTTSGEPCKNAPIRGGNVCHKHGGSAPQVRRKATLRLLELVDPAIATLAREMVKADKSADRQRAANSILDRAGVPRSVTSPDANAARDLLVERLKQLRTKQEAGDMPAAEDYEGTLE